MEGLDKNKKYIVACSFGPDSMALLNMLIVEGYDVVVAHVNYHKRDASNFEEESLRKYCKDHNVQIEVLDTSGLTCNKNFQEWAREVRYSFFKKVLDKFNAEAVLVAHQQDDLIETYLMQKHRGGFVKNPGIAEKTTIFNVDIIRPLLSYSKADLLKYDEENNVPFSIDCSNLRDDYDRNKIRHNIVDKMSKDERNKTLSEIETIRKQEIEFKTAWLINDFLNLSDYQMTMVISNFVETNSKHIDISSKFIQEIRQALSSDKSIIEIKLSNKLFLMKDYGEVRFVDKEKTITYRYELNKGDHINDNLFEIDFSKGQEDRNICDADYPLVVKPVDKDDFLRIKDYECKVRRLFIDWKLPHHLRDSWPGIYNKDGKLIYVPRYRKDFVDNHTSTFVIKFIK